MEITQEKYYPNPRERANFFSVLFFGYSVDMFKKGLAKTLQVEDLYNPLTLDRSQTLGNNLQRNWNKEIKKSKKSNEKPSFLKALIATFWLEFFLLGLLLLITDVILKVIQPLVLGKLLDYFKTNSTVSKDYAIIYGSILVGINVVNVILFNQHYFGVVHGGMRIRAATCALIYRKALSLSKTALGDTASGKIVNLLSNDVSRFDIVSVFLHQMWAAPAAALIVLVILYNDAGFAGIIGVIVIFLVTLSQAYTGKLSAIYRKETAQKTDERVRLMDEILSGIQVIKMYAWEIPFKKVIRIARENEIKIITKSSYLRGILMGFNLCTTRISLFCGLLTLVLTKEEITASRVFVITSYFNFLSLIVANIFSRGFSEIAEVLVAIRRIRDFLLNEEYDPIKTEAFLNKDDKNVVDVKDRVTLKNLTVKWNIHYMETALDNINLSVPDQRLVGIIGSVGSGKSSLLQTMLGELDVVSGDMKIRGQISYASQEAWIFAATIRQNILFGQKYDKKRYQEVVKVCALDKDFEQFENGDFTIVGDRGASLSGGQKARINLARAVYREADIYLLDDPLSAVDIHVSKILYEKCINGYLAKKTRILVTHQVHYLKNADQIIILNNGRIENEGTFNSLANSDTVYAQLLTAEPENPEPEQKPIKRRPSRQQSYPGRTKSINSLSSNPSIADIALLNDIDNEEEQDSEDNKINVKDLQEESSKGKIRGNLLLQYVRAGVNVFGTCRVVVLLIGAQLFVSGVDYWVSYWVNFEEKIKVTNGTTSPLPTFIIPSINLTTNNCLYIYSILLVFMFVLAMIRSIYFIVMAMSSSRTLHSMIFDNIIGATMRFFDTNPGGRIMNRFSKDIGSIDELLPKIMLDAAQFSLATMAAFLLIVVVNPYFLILIAVLSLVLGLIRHVYLKSSKNIKRLEGIMRSPVFTHLKATLEGLTTIRAFRAQNILMDEFDSHQDYHSSAWYMFIVANNAFGFYVDIFCACFFAALTFSFIFFSDPQHLMGGEVGLALTQATVITFMLQYAIRSSAEITNQLMSVERILEYKVLPKEIQPTAPKTISKDWPQTGQIVFKDMCLRYFEGGPLVLKQLNLVIKPNEKVGVVGRTGAGKSSIIQALFRLTPVEGSIKIDDVDTKNISLGNLRSKISIIPQDPVLFSGTLRYNLDPFDEYTDDVLYKAIEDVELKDPANIINRLENKVMDRGSNYSVGQRQLICLARAILKNNKVLMLDEATANVDPQTDALIQKTIRQKFKECTVITVAHRLNTIMDSDKVLVMDAGNIAEFDHPHLLLQNKNGIFYHMVEETGKATSELLKNEALSNYRKITSLHE